MNTDWDTVVVGQSFAGLSAALTLGRMRRSVLAIGSGGPRNEAVAHAHGLLTQDGANPNDLMSAATADLDKYPTVQRVNGRVTAIESQDDCFRVSFDGRTTTATTIILATGVNDDPLPIPGVAEHWGRGVFTCPFCDGFEHQDLPLAVAGDPQITPHVSRLLTAVSDRVTIYAPIADDARAQLTDAGVSVDSRKIARVIGDGTSINALELDDGTIAETGALFIAGMPHPNNQLALALGCNVDDLGFVEVGPTGRTNIDSVWAAGDLSTRHHQIATAIAQGATVGAECAAILVLAP